MRMQYVCSQCGYESGKWYGRCPECQSWNTFEEVRVPEIKGVKRKGQVYSLGEASPKKLSEIKSEGWSRVSTGLGEFDRVLGGGIVPGSVVLLAGDPGIGKSTLLLQLALNLAKGVGASSSLAARKLAPRQARGSDIQPSRESKSPPSPHQQGTILYVSGEESLQQIKMRAERLSPEKTISGSSLFVSSNNDIDQITEVVEETSPSLVVIDSIQTMVSRDIPGFAGSIPQVRYAAQRLISIAKRNLIPVFMIGHVTKEGFVAGPMVLSHLVDTVVYLEGEALTGTRILRVMKNRFGDVTEVGIFLMEERGLGEVTGAETFFIDKKDGHVPGSCITVIMEGARPFLLEIQALVVPSVLSFPKRASLGISDRRLELLLAVLRRFLKIPVERLDIFVNVVGGLRIQDTSCDLACCLAIVSSFKNKALSSSVAIGEVGLLSEIKQVGMLERKIAEAKKFGFKNIVSGKNFGNLGQVVKMLL